MSKKLSTLWRFSGVVGVAILWVTVTASMSRAGLGIIDNRPLSYLGVNTSTAHLFSIGLLLSSAGFVGFAFYVYRIYQPGRNFLIYFLIGQLGQIIAAIVPYGDNSKYRLIHTVAAFVLAFSLPLFIGSFARSQKLKPHAKLFKQLFVFELLLFVVGMAIFTQTDGIAPIGEALPAIGFHIWICIITLLPPIVLPEQKFKLKVPD